MGEPYASAVRPGLQSLRRSHRACVSASDTQRLTGSIDLDDTLRNHPKHASASRWDYGVGFLAPDQKTRCATWVEVHPATNRDVSFMAKKLAWLLAWLRHEAPTLLPLTESAQSTLDGTPYVWVATGTVSVAKGGRSLREYAALGGTMPVRKVRLP